jgi:hypothetical protein
MSFEVVLLAINCLIQLCFNNHATAKTSALILPSKFIPDYSTKYTSNFPYEKEPSTNSHTSVPTVATLRALFYPV